jgi:hypothetical protein
MFVRFSAVIAVMSLLSSFALAEDAILRNVRCESMLSKRGLEPDEQ